MTSRHERPADPGRLVRPYAVTGGRTRSSHIELVVETLISTTPMGIATASTLGPERQAIAQLCQEVLSVAEISAHLDLPIGVTRILIGDMADDGLVEVHQSRPVNDRPDLALMERVLYGLRTF